MENSQSPAHNTPELDTFFSLALDLFCIADFDGYLTKVNPAWQTTLGYSPQELEGKQFLDFVHPDDVQATLAMMFKLEAQVPVLNFINRYRHKEGGYRFIEWRSQPQGRLIYATARDVTQHHTQQTLQGHLNQVLEAIAESQSLATILEKLVLAVEEYHPLMKASVLLLDQATQTLQHGVAPSLPSELNQGINGTKIGSGQGSCGTAAYEKRLVIVEDIDTDPLWDDFRHLTQPYGLKACWSYPIIHYDGTVLGTFALYYHEIRQPSTAELELIHLIAHIAGISIRRKNEEEALKVSEERYRIISELMSDYAYSYRVEPDKTLVREWITDSYVRMTGRQVGEENRRDVYTLYVPEDRERAKADVEIVLQGKPTLSEYRIINDTGNELWIQVSRYPVWDEKEKRVVRFYGASQDITERKRIENARIDSENRLSAIFETSIDAIILATADGDVLNCNAAAERMFGYTKEQIMAENGARLVDLSDPRLLPATEERINTGKFFGELTFLRSNGEKFEGEVASNMFTDVHQNKFMTLILRDVDERKHAEEALRRSEERHRIISELISDYAYAYSVDADKQITLEWTTESYARMTGYKVGEIGKQGSFELYELEDQERVAADIQMVLQGKPSQNDYRIITKTGEKRWIHISRYPIWNKQEQRVVRFYGAAKDITDQKKAHQQLIELAVEKQRMQVLANFMQATSHDLRTPMTSITTGLYLVRKIQDEEKRNKKIQEVERAVFYLSKLLTQFQKMALLDTHTKLPLHIGNLHNAIDSALASVQKQIIEKKLHIITHLSPDNLLVRLDEDSFETALIEIIENATRFTQEGGTIEIRSMLTPDQQISLEIVDNGVGIPADSLPRIFERFFKVNEARNTGGSGLGLAIAKRTIELHHGSIEVESIEGEGTTFRILLPTIT